MPHYAHATVIGHLGQDPDLRETQSGTKVVNCSLATSHKRQGEQTTTWWRISLFGKRAEAVAQYLRKGDPALFSGEPVLRPWTDKDGNQRVSLELLASDFAFVGTKDRQQQQDAYLPPPAGYSGHAPQQQAPAQTYRPEHQPSPAPANSEGFDPTDDIPF